MKHPPLSRRTVLKGLGAAIALPFLEAMIPISAMAQTAANKRYLAMVFPNGYFPGTWNFESTLSPIAPYKNYVSILTNMNNPPGQASAGGAHEAESTCTLTTATCPNQNNGGPAPSPRLYYSSGGPQMSVDQAIADAVGGGSRRKSIVIAPTNDLVFLQNGYHIDNVRYISWRGNTPVTAFSQISALFNDIFGGGGTSVDPQAQLRNQKRQSILDYVKDSSTELNKKLGTEDKRRVASFFDAIRSVETRLQSMPMPMACSSAGAPNNVPSPDSAGNNFDAWTKANLDLIVLAFQCGHTKVASYAMASGGSCISQHFRWTGDPDCNGYHHNYSHYEQTDPINSWNSINKWYAKQLAYVMQKMMAINEGGTNMLDNSMILFMSGMEEGHQFLRLPIVVAGKGGGTLSPNGGVRDMGGSPLSALHLTMAQKMGAGLTGFGRSSSTDATLNTKTVAV